MLTSTLLSADGGVIDTTQPTGTDPFIIVYTVTNSAGLTTTLRRTVEVADPCTAPLTYCTSTGTPCHADCSHTGLHACCDGLPNCIG